MPGPRQAIDWEKLKQLISKAPAILMLLQQILQLFSEDGTPMPRSSHHGDDSVTAEDILSSALMTAHLAALNCCCVEDDE